MDVQHCIILKAKAPRDSMPKGSVICTAMDQLETAEE